jgi:hypothetical protein
MDLTEVRKNMFFGEKVYYPLEGRNDYVLTGDADSEGAIS